MFPAIFIDRDGVIIENRDNYVRSWEDVSIYDQALRALAQVSNYPYQIIIITNQSAVGRGLITLDTALDINRRLVDEIRRAGGRVDGTYICPHAPNQECDCRKPKPGLLFRAARELSIDLSRSLLIGDALSDVGAGKAARLKLSILVKTGLGAQQALLPEASSLKPFPIYDTLSDALADLILYARG
jgi:D-glycero-D-manno-heptose 1,7-bisphosphate phosphatase